MKFLENALNNATAEVMGVTATQTEMGIALTECFPAMVYQTIVVDGKTYRVKVEVTVTEA